MHRLEYCFNSDSLRALLSGLCSSPLHQLIDRRKKGFQLLQTKRKADPLSEEANTLFEHLLDQKLLHSDDSDASGNEKRLRRNTVPYASPLCVGMKDILDKLHDEDCKKSSRKERLKSNEYQQNAELIKPDVPRHQCPRNKNGVDMLPVALNMNKNFVFQLLYNVDVLKQIVRSSRGNDAQTRTDWTLLYEETKQTEVVSRESRGSRGWKLTSSIGVARDPDAHLDALIDSCSCAPTY